MILKYNIAIAVRPTLLIKIKKDRTEYNEWIMEKKIENGYDIIFYINEEGNYDVSISADKDKSNIYSSIVNFKIECNSSPNIKKSFPEFKSDYKNDDSIELISPLESELMQGQNYNFVIKTETYDKLYLLQGFSYYEVIEMDREETTFKVNNLMIHGIFVSINYKEVNQNNEEIYNSLVTYTTIGKDIYFPETSETPFKKKLESPLEEDLIHGQTYDFKIICDTIYSIIIEYDNNQIELDKNGNIYTKTITISGNFELPNELFIYYGPVDDNYLQMYMYNIIEE